jgi:hypothetical protein
MQVRELVERYGAAWNAEELERRALLEEVWADDGIYCDPTATAEGREALVAHIGAVQAMLQDHTIELRSGIDEHDGRFRFAWAMLGPDGAEVTEGVDFGALAPDGRIGSITGFFGPLPPA